MSPHLPDPAPTLTPWPPDVPRSPLRRVPDRADVVSPVVVPEPLESMLARLRANPPPPTRMLRRTYPGRVAEPATVAREAAPAGAWVAEVERRGR